MITVAGVFPATLKRGEAMGEHWKQIEEYPDYFISDFGQVKSAKGNKEKILKPGKYPNGYKFVTLCQFGKCKNFMIHRIVAIAFIPNPNIFPVVNHKDGNKQNNKVKNLEWCTSSENFKHAVNKGLHPGCCIKRSVIVETPLNWKIEFSTMKSVAAFFGFKKSWLHNRIRRCGKEFSYQGYTISVNERG